METNWIMENPQNLAAVFEILVVGAWLVAIVMTEVLPDYYKPNGKSAGQSSARSCGC